MAGPLAPEHPAHGLSMAQYSVLAALEHLGRCAAVDVARALTLDRSTVLRHLQTLEANGLVHRDLGDWFYPFVRPLFVITYDGSAAMRAARRARVRRLEQATLEWPLQLQHLVARCLELLTTELHDQVELERLPRGMGGRDRLPNRHRRWHHKGPTPAEKLDLPQAHVSQRSLEKQNWRGALTIKGW